MNFYEVGNKNMDRCKLEYLIKNFDIKEKKEIIREMDPCGTYFLKKHCSAFLLNPDDPYLLEYFQELEYFPEMKDEIIQEAIIHYKKVNDLCINNNTYPFFKNPTNFKECEETRLDLVKMIPKEILNEFFGVKHIRYYEPPKYSEGNF